MFLLVITSCQNDGDATIHPYDAAEITGKVIGLDTALSNKEQGNSGEATLLMHGTGNDTLYVPLSGNSAIRMISVLYHRKCAIEDLSATISKATFTDIVHTSDMYPYRLEVQEGSRMPTGIDARFH